MTDSRGAGGAVILSVKEAAQKLGVSGSRVRMLLAEGRLPGKKLGNTWAVLGLDYQRKSPTRRGGRPKGSRDRKNRKEAK
jgi:excisionase family DNA binding protein